MNKAVAGGPLSALNFDGEMTDLPLVPRSYESKKKSKVRDGVRRKEDRPLCIVRIC